MIKHAALIPFKDGVSEEEARAALESIADVIELPYCSGFGLTIAEVAERAEVAVGDHVKAFDDEWGSPVWYIP